MTKIKANLKKIGKSHSLEVDKTIFSRYECIFTLFVPTFGDSHHFWRLFQSFGGIFIIWRHYDVDNDPNENEKKLPKNVLSSTHSRSHCATTILFFIFSLSHLLPVKIMSLL